jgi:hypothetical protein
MIRALSSDPSQGEGKKETGKDSSDTSEIVLTPGQKVVEASRLTLWTGIAVLAACCAYYIGRELFPTYVFNKIRAASALLLYTYSFAVLFAEGR